MCSRIKVLSEFYGQFDEDARLQSTRQGQLEYAVTMHYIHRFASSGAKVLEVGAGTGRYSIPLAQEGLTVTAIELVESNLGILQENSKNLDNLRSFQGDATDLWNLPNNTFDLTLVFGPLYHLYDPNDVHKAIDEAIRVTKRNGVLLFSFLSVYAIMYANYFSGNWSFGQSENFSEDCQVKHCKEQVFTGYDISEFEELFSEKPVRWIATTGTDGFLEMIEKRPDFMMTEQDFGKFVEWYLKFSENRELLGGTSHLLYICRKE